MNTKFELNKSWSKLVSTKAIKKRINADMSDVEFDVLCFISLEPTTRATIMRTEYFFDISLSTIKRAVNQLIHYGLVIVTSSKDGREKLLTIKGEE